jgi:hypothetical protein
MLKPQILSADAGYHNANMDATIRRIDKSASWKKLDTIMLIPAGGTIPFRTMMALMNVYPPPNNSFYRMGVEDAEVGQAFSTAIENILAHPQLSKYKYIWTVEHDNLPQPDALVRLLAQMEAHPEFACIGGIYFTKGPEGVAQIWGDPRDPINNYRPQTPIPNALQECCGTGMGCNVWRLDMFKDPKLRKPWFKTQTEGGVSTQDLYFWSDARQHGYRCAIDTSIPVGHLDLAGTFGPPNTVW